MREIKRICIFCENWGSGGIESFLRNVLVSMDLTDLEVDIVAARLGESVFTDQLQKLGIRFYQLSGKLRSPANGRAFAALLKKGRYDIVYLNIFQGLSFYYGYLAKKAGVPMRIAHSHGAGLRNSPGKGLKLRLHRLGRKLWSSSMTDFWACSTPAARFLFGDGRKWTFLPNGIETERFRFQPEARQEERAALGLREDQLLVGTVGRLSGEKNQGFLLEVFQVLKKSRPDSVLLLVGKGEDRAKLEETARTLGIEDSVIFYGTTTRVERLYWAMDVFLFPSLTEGLGIAGVEAQAAGLPVVCSTGVPPEAAVTGWAQRLELSAGAEKWAEAALKAKGPSDRGSAAEAVSTGGYNIEKVAERIRKEWMR